MMRFWPTEQHGSLCLFISLLTHAARNIIRFVWWNTELLKDGTHSYNNPIRYNFDSILVDVNTNMITNKKRVLGIAGIITEITGTVKVVSHMQIWFR